MAGLNIDLDPSGPLFDGRAPAIIDDLVREAAWVVGTKALSEVQMLLDASIRNPTPYYETQITIDRRVDDVRVHDRGIIYGPWLEGTGSRNRTTRFKGYASFRRAAQEIERRVPEIVEPVVRRMVAELNGAG
jgi:hypothetical protein